MTRLYNFSAGPSALPTEVLEHARGELLDWHGMGTSVMEISHRGKAFSTQVAETAEQDLRQLLQISDDYAVLFIQGGATGQFSMIPLNLLARGQSADYIETGMWSQRAAEEAKRYADIRIAMSGQENGFTTIPEMSRWRLNPDAAYVHYCPNETLSGLAFPFIPETQAPLVADMSSTLLSQPLDVSRFGVIYAGAQKNMGIAGLCVMIIHKDLLREPSASCPRIFQYRKVWEQQSMLNTPPTFAWYISGLVFQWIKRQGGLDAMKIRNQRKACALYQCIDESDLYTNPIEAQNRSWMNVSFFLKDTRLNEVFLQESEQAGLLYLKGHKALGGMRASLYNAVPEQAVTTLIEFMRDFAKRYG